MKGAMDKYSISQADLEFRLDNVPNQEGVLKVLNTIQDILEEGKDSEPKVNYLVIFIVTGRGILKDGMGQVVLNEFNSATCFYHLVEIEKYIRETSRTFDTNSYFLGLFACSSELYNSDQMKGQSQSLTTSLTEKVATVNV